MSDHTETAITESIERVERFIRQYPTLRGLDPETVYTIHVEDEPTPLTISDLATLVRAAKNGRKREGER